jgi:uncharacterized YigZ family protein
MVENKTEFLTVDRRYGPVELKEKGSRFIAYLFPVCNQVEAEAEIAGLRKQYHDASHVCFAFRLGEGREDYFRYNDDGEPSGTAGLPIYNEIKGKDYLNVLAAVVRYFGGTKLGTGGLARAYAAAAQLVLARSQPLLSVVKKEASLTFPYDFTGEVMHLVRTFSLDILSQHYTDQGVHLRLHIPLPALEDLTRALTQKSAGHLKLNFKS